MMHPDESHSPGKPGPIPFKPLTRILGDVQRVLVDRCRALLEKALLAAEHDLGRGRGGSPETAADLQAQREILLQRMGETLQQGFQLLVLPSAQRNELAASLAAQSAPGAFDWEASLADKCTALRATLSRDLDAATKRLDHLVLQVEVNAGNNPLEPAAISRAFVVAVAGAAALTAQARAALARQFQSHLLEGLAPIYQDINRVLTEARILPDVVEGSFEPPEAVTPPPRKTADWAAVVAAPAVAPVASQAAVPEKPQAALPVVDPDPPLGSFAAAVSAEVAAPPRILPTEAPQVNPGRRTAVAPGQASQSSDRVAALCTALFDEIRADPEIPDPVKKELAKLQLVYTLYALNRAPDFLSKAEHPARILIELLWEMGRSLNGTRSLVSHPRYRAIVEVVDEIRERKSPSEQDFFQVYCMLLALQ